MKNSAFINRGYYIEFEPKFDIQVWSANDICSILEIEQEQFNYLIERTGKQASLASIKTVYNINFIYKNKKLIEVTTIGMYLLSSLNFELKKNYNLNNYVEFFKNLAINDLLRYQGYKQKKQPNNRDFSKQINNIPEQFRVTSFEDMQVIKSHKIDPKYKIANLDIEDKSHIFYGKNILITGNIEGFIYRNEIAALIWSYGGCCKESVTKVVDYVIVGNDAGPAKLKKVADLNIKTLSDIEFLDLFKDYKFKYS